MVGSSAAGSNKRWLVWVLVAALVLGALAVGSLVLGVTYVESQQPRSLTAKLRKQVLDNRNKYERVAQTAITAARVREGELKADALAPSDQWMAERAEVDGILIIVPMPSGDRWMSANGTVNVEDHDDLGYVARFGLSSGILGEGVDLVYAPGWTLSTLKSELGDAYPVTSSWFLVYST
jgi:hypothetical protein